MNPSHGVAPEEAASAVEHTIGPAGAAVTIVEYGDFECPACRRAAPAVRLLLHRFDGHIRFVFRHFPLEALHPHAMHAAEAAESAGAQGRFWPMHDLLFDTQAHLKLPQLRGYAEHVGLDMARYAADMNDHPYLQRIREHMQSGVANGIRSTPAFFVNGRIKDVSFGMDSLYAEVETLLRRHRSAAPDSRDSGRASAPTPAGADVAPAEPAAVTARP